MPNEAMWDREEIEGAFKIPRLEKAFIEHVHLDWPAGLRQRIGELASRISPHRSHDLYFYFFATLEQAVGARQAQQATLPSPSPGASSSSAAPGWADDFWAYLHPDSIGTVKGHHTATLWDLNRNLDYYMDHLGLRVFYLLPVTTSPNRDGRYDVADYRHIDPSLGGDAAYHMLIKEIRKRGGRVIIEMIPAHISEQHAWFQNALAGDPYYLDFFLHTDAPPPGRVLEQKDGNVWIEYQGSGPIPSYRRLLLFPDWCRTHWNPHTIGQGDQRRTRWFYSSFFPFQKDLNLQNPDVLRQHLQTIGHWLALGVSGIRADAVPWWIKPAGHCGQHAPETGLLCELFHTFIKHIDREALFLPELVEDTATSLHYLGPPTKINGIETGRRADTVFAFEKMVYIFYAGVSGNFAAWHHHLHTGLRPKLPKNTRLLLYTANHHDEIYLGFLDETAKKDFSARIRRCGGVVYKNGNSGGAMAADLLGHDVERIHHFYKFLMGHFGTIAVYGGTEMALPNCWSYALHVTIEHLQAMRKEGRIAALHPVFEQIRRWQNHLENLDGPPDRASPIYRFIDGRLLHRNRILQAHIDKAKIGQNKTVEHFKQLIAARKQSPALMHGGPEQPLNTLRQDVGSFMRRKKSGGGRILDEVAVIKNGTAARTTVNVSLTDLTVQKHFSLFEIERKQPVEFTLNRKKRYLTLALNPHQTLWLQVRPIESSQEG
jgi:glycosidase